MNSLMMHMFFLSMLVFWSSCYAQENVAQGKTTLMYDNFNNQNDQAVDGCYTSTTDCCSTVSVNGWWAIDLDAVYEIRSLVITNGNSATHISAASLGGFSVLALSAMPAEWASVSGQQCGEYTGRVPEDQSVPVPCEVSTQYLAIQQSEAFMLCEVEIYGPAVSVDVLPTQEPSPDTSTMLTIQGNKRLTGELLDTYTGIKLIQCVRQCLHHESCLRMNYHQTEGVCELLGHSDYTTDDQDYEASLLTLPVLESSSGWQFLSPN